MNRALFSEFNTKTKMIGLGLALGMASVTTYSLANDKKLEPKKENAASESAASESEKLLRKAACENLPQRSSEDLWRVAECFRNENDIRQAVASLREITRKDPKDIEAAFIAAWLIWEEGHKKGGREEQSAIKEALDELKKSRINNPTHWLIDTEIGDFYFLRMQAPHLAYPEYLKARSHYDGDFARNVDKASVGRKASIENRIARSAEAIGRKGEAVEASCRALFFDPDDKEALERIEKLSGSCERKAVSDPRNESKNP
jgi:tetratricopeptide (TPR) repeat protein